MWNLPPGKTLLTRQSIPFAVCFSLLAMGVFVFLNSRQNASAQSGWQFSVPKTKPEIVATYPHDTDAFTQGLLMHEGRLFESTGRYGKSTLRETTLTSGTVVR